MKRIQRKRSKGWKMPPNAKYVGRPTKWGNPFRLTPDRCIQVYSATLRRWIQLSHRGGFCEEDVVQLYSRWLDGGLKSLVPFLPPPPSIEELKGKDLACFCPLSSPCHVDVILERIGSACA